MFNLGFGEILVICVILIVVVGPERLPTLMKNVGKGMRTVREATREIRTTIGIDELMHEDVLQPAPPVRQPPAATVSRAAVAQAQPLAQALPPETNAPEPPSAAVAGTTDAAADAVAEPTASPRVAAVDGGDQGAA